MNIVTNPDLIIPFDQIKMPMEDSHIYSTFFCVSTCTMIYIFIAQPHLYYPMGNNNNTRAQQEDKALAIPDTN